MAAKKANVNSREMARWKLGWNTKKWVRTKAVKIKRHNMEHSGLHSVTFTWHITDYQFTVVVIGKKHSDF